MKNILFILLFLTVKGFSQTIGGYITPNNLPLKGYDTAGQVIGKSGRTYILKRTNVVSPLALPNDSTIALTTPLAVQYGGTGNSTFTAYSVIAAGTTSTGAFQNVSGVGTSGQVLTSNGAGALPTWQAGGGGGGGAADSAYFWNYKNGNVGGHLTIDTNIYVGTNQNTNLRLKTNNIQRMVIDSTGNIGVGMLPTTLPSTLFHVAGSSLTNSQMRVGSFEVQNASAVNNLIISDNVIYNSGFKRRAAGYGNFIQMIGQEMQFNVCATSTAGSAVTGVIPLKINTDGRVGIGGVQNLPSAGSFTNMTTLIDANAMSVGKLGAAAASNSLIDMTSTTRGLLLPRWTESQVGTNTAGGTMGLIGYDSASNSIVAHNGVNFTGRFFIVSAGTTTLIHGSDYVFTGTTSTWTLPAVSGVLLGRQNGITIKNRGSGTITLNSNSGNTLYTTSAVGTINIVAGAACELMPDGTYFNVMFNQ